MTKTGGISDMLAKLRDLELVKKFNALQRSDKAGLIGAAIGMAGGGIGGYLLTDRKKGRIAKIRNAILMGLAGGGVGAFAGKGISNHLSWKRRMAEAGKLSAGEKARPGTLYYVDYDLSKNTLNDKDIPIPVQNIAKKIHEYNSEHDPFLNIGHGELLAIPDDGNGAMSLQVDNNGLKSNGKPGVSWQHEWKDKLVGKKPNEISEFLRTHRGFGTPKGIYAIHVPDVGVAKRYYDAWDRDKGEWYDFLPGGINCATLAREAIDAAREDKHKNLSHLADLFWGGFATAQRPTIGTEYFKPGK